MHVHAVNHAVRALHETVRNRIVRKTEQILVRFLFRRGSVQLHFLERKPGSGNGAVLFLFVGGRSEIHVIIVNEYAAVVILRHEQRRHHALRRAVRFCFQRRFRNAIQRAFLHFAVGVIRRSFRRAVDKVYVIPRFHKEPAVGSNLVAFGIRLSGRREIAASAGSERCRRARKRSHSQKHGKFFLQTPHI